MARAIDYGNLMHRAMRGLIQQVLTDVARDGLPGEHHFFITFDTDHPDVEIADWLSDRFPGEMTVVMQHWFDKLQVTDEGFAVTLSFGDVPEPLYIPYDAIKTFVDPSVEFGLRFESSEDETGDAPIHIAPEPGGTRKPTVDDKKQAGKDNTDENADIAGGGSIDVPGEKQQDADIVSLDSFRK